MRAEVDAELCEGYATCVAIAPDVFKLDEWGYAYVEAEGAVPPGQKDVVQRAALECPMNAIRYDD